MLQRHLRIFLEIADQLRHRITFNFAVDLWKSWSDKRQSLFINSLTLPRLNWRYIQSTTILGDPGGVLVGRDNRMFVVKVYFKIGNSPWALTLTEPVPEGFELPASEWPEKKGDSGVFLHDVVFLIDHQWLCTVCGPWSATIKNYYHQYLTTITS